MERWYHQKSQMASFFPHLYNLVPPLGIDSRKFACNCIRDHVLGVIVMHIDFSTLKGIDHCDCPHTLWTKIWEIHGDHDNSTIPGLSHFRLFCASSFFSMDSL
jgi:hypothetical protein